jgi:hypothetical protein
MNLARLLQQRQEELLAEATTALKRARLPHPEASAAAAREALLRSLYDAVLRCVQRRDLLPMLEYAESLAYERFSRGLDLKEILVAFNVLEEAVWQYITIALPAESYAEAFDLTGTVIGAGKEALAGQYVSLARLGRTTPLDGPRRAEASPRHHAA